MIELLFPLIYSPVVNRYVQYTEKVKRFDEDSTSILLLHSPDLGMSLRCPKFKR